jgi:hypothetical protein
MPLKHRSFLLRIIPTENLIVDHQQYFFDYANFQNSPTDRNSLLLPPSLLQLPFQIPQRIGHESIHTFHGQRAIFSQTIEKRALRQS